MESAAPLQTGQAIRKRTVCCIQISIRPVGEPQKSSSRSTLVVVIRRQEIDCPPSVHYGARQIAESLGTIGTGIGDGGWQRLKLFIVHHDHLWAEFILSPSTTLRINSFGELTDV